mmetsp:Transcript_15004/g.44393  ORF Transcript_15004/g.44393 Transcript_15004/m.44393 type:complete len:231 (+) Transcript_15004:189-881(+)
MRRRYIQEEQGPQSCFGLDAASAPATASLTIRLSSSAVFSASDFSRYRAVMPPTAAMRPDSTTIAERLSRRQPDSATRMKAAPSETMASSASPYSRICRAEKPAATSACSITASSTSSHPASNSPSETVPSPSTSSCACSATSAPFCSGSSSVSKKYSNSAIEMRSSRSRSSVSKIVEASTGSASPSPARPPCHSPRPCTARSRFSSAVSDSSSAFATAAAAGSDSVSRW